MKKIIFTSMALLFCLQTQSAFAMRLKELPDQLLHAATWGDVKEVKALIAKGVQINAKDIWGNTPLHLAASKGPSQAKITNAEIEKAHLERGSEFGVPEEFKYAYPSTATIAHAEDFLATVRALVKAGADKTAKNNAGKTPEELAKETNQPVSVIQALK